MNTQHQIKRTLSQPAAIVDVSGVLKATACVHRSALADVWSNGAPLCFKGFETGVEREVPERLRTGQRDQSTVVVLFALHA